MRTVYLVGVVIKNHPNPTTNGIQTMSFEEPRNLVRFLRSLTTHSRLEKVIFLDAVETNSDPLGES